MHSGFAKKETTITIKITIIIKITFTTFLSSADGLMAS